MQPSLNGIILPARQQPLQLHHGNAMALLPTLAGSSVDAVITDPPYGTTAAAWDACPPWADLFRELWRVLKPNGALLMFSQNPMAADIITAQRRYFRYEWVWEKPNAVGVLNSKRMPLRAHELVLVFYRKLPTYNRVPLDNQRGTPYKGHGGAHQIPIYKRSLCAAAGSADGTRCPRDVVRFGREQHTIHPTQKPLALCRYLVEQYTNPGDIVLDPFSGGGTTLAACAATGRRGIGIELDTGFYQAACARLGITAAGT